MTEQRLCPWCWPDPPNELHGEQEACGDKCRQRKSRWLKNHPDGIMPWDITDTVTGVTNPGHSVTADSEVLVAMKDISERQLEVQIDNNRLLRENNEMLRDIADRLERQPQPQPPRLQPVMPPPEEGDTAEIEIKRASVDEDNNSSYNFMISGAQINGKFDGLPPEVIDYGLETGRIAREQIQ